MSEKFPYDNKDSLTLQLKVLRSELEAVQRENASLKLELSQAGKQQITVDASAAARSLASTVRQCQRTGHPDLSKHLESLLKVLGA